MATKKSSKAARSAAAKASLPVPLPTSSTVFPSTLSPRYSWATMGLRPFTTRE